MKRKKKVKTRKKKILFLIALILLLLIPFFLIRINFFLGEPLHVTLSPKEVQLYLQNGMEKVVPFSISIKKFPLCTSDCELRLKDYANGKEHTESIEIKEGTDFQKNITFKVPEEGTGTNAYRYDVKCTNQDKFFCPSNNEEHLSSSFITLNYDLSEENKDYKNKSLEGLLIIGREMSASYTNLDSFLNLKRSVNHSFENLPPYLSQIASLEYYSGELEKIGKEFNDTESLMTEENYQNANPIIDHLKDKTVNFSMTVNDTLNYLIETSKEYNSIVDWLNSVPATRLDHIFRFYQILANSNQSIKYWVALSNSTKLIRNIQLIEHGLGYAKSLSNISIDRSIGVYDSLNESYAKDYPNVINNSEEVFLNYSKFLPENESIGYKTSIKDNQSPVNICMIMKRTEEELESVNYTINGTIGNQTSNISRENQSNTSTNFSAGQSIQFGINLSEFLKAKSIICNLSGQNNTIFSQMEHRKINLDFTLVQYNFSLPKIEPKCCYDSVCDPCCVGCENNESLFPILFLHGHAFSKGISPEASLNSMVPLMEAMEKEGYINAGEVESGEEDADWSRFNRPIIARVSYYYISYLDLGINILQSQKSDGIENYALRLNEIINDLLQMTGKKKVNIIAHSMGGLVAREYINIFGQDKVDRLVLIATPNKGISGNPEKLCSVAGAAKECSDMEQGSIFLKRLNSDVPEGIKIYTITATDCQMEGGLGDGIVLENSSRLDYAKDYTIHGNCTDIFSSNLHTDIIKPKKYPETVEILKEIFS